MKSKQHNYCTVRRKKLVTLHNYNMGTGAMTLKKQEWQIEPCGHPLFNAHEMGTGICQSCAGGWTHPENFPCDELGNPISSSINNTQDGTNNQPKTQTV